jgi:hypothetical protein
MSRSSDVGRVLAALAMLVPVLALSGVTIGGAPAPAPVPPARHRPPRWFRHRRPARPAVSGITSCAAGSTGALLFEDRINLPADAAAYGIRMSGTDRNGRPMYVAETRNATCLVRIAPDERYWPG